MNPHFHLGQKKKTLPFQCCWASAGDPAQSIQNSSLSEPLFISGWSLSSLVVMEAKGMGSLSLILASRESQVC